LNTRSRALSRPLSLSPLSLSSTPPLSLTGISSSSSSSTSL
jgi:hypothetical protein